MLPTRPRVLGQMLWHGAHASGTGESLYSCLDEKYWCGTDASGAEKTVHSCLKEAYVSWYPQIFLEPQLQKW